MWWSSGIMPNQFGSFEIRDFYLYISKRTKIIKFFSFELLLKSVKQKLLFGILISDVRLVWKTISGSE